MARGYNKVILIGNLGQDPDARSTPSGSQVVNLTLATDESYKDRQTGQMVPKTEWHRIVLFGKIAEIAAQYLKKGSKVLIEGKLQTRKWQNKEGHDVYTTEVVVDINGAMQMLDSAPSDHSQQPTAGGYGSGGSTNASTGYQGGGQSSASRQEPQGYQPDNGYGGYGKSTGNAGLNDDEENPDDDVPF